MMNLRLLNKIKLYCHVIDNYKRKDKNHRLIIIYYYLQKQLVILLNKKLNYIKYIILLIKITNNSMNIFNKYKMDLNLKNQHSNQLIICKK